ncbi:MAG: hypothetical protein ACX94A_14845 [Algiphilus sp.]
MLRYLQIANVVLLAFGVTFVVTLSVVAVLLAFWVDEFPKYESTLTGVLRVVLLSGILAAAGGLCVRSLQRRWPLWPALQVAGWGVSMVVLFVGLNMLGVG